MNDYDKIVIGGKYYDCCGDKRKSKNMVLAIPAKLRGYKDKERTAAVEKWIERFTEKNINFYAQPFFEYHDETYVADFYLPDCDAFVVIKNDNPVEYRVKDDAVASLAHITERNIIIGYYDGQFRVIDYLFNCEQQAISDNQITKPLIADKDCGAYMCPECENIAFQSSIGWNGCRRCGKVFRLEPLSERVLSGTATFVED
jgi:hypothetical protein